MLSNLDFVTESLTLIAGNKSFLYSANWYNLKHPVVVSSETPTISLAIVLNLFGLSGIIFFKILNNSYSSSVSTESGFGKEPSNSYYSSHFTPKWIIKVASPPSSTNKVGPFPPGHVKAFKVHSQYSTRFSPFQANTLADPL